MDEKLTDELLDRLLTHYTAPDEGHSTPLQRQTLTALQELKRRRLEGKCEHGIPRQFCTGAH